LFTFYSAKWVASPFKNYIVACSRLVVDFFLFPYIIHVLPSILAVNVVGVDDVQRVVPLESFFTEVERH
jgi:hypothetical protein